MLEIKNLSVSVQNKIIINNLNLEIEKGNKVAIMGTIGIIMLASALILHDVLHNDQHSDGFLSILITVAGSLILIFSHFRNRRLCLEHSFKCHE